RWMEETGKLRRVDEDPCADCLIGAWRVKNIDDVGDPYIYDTARGSSGRCCDQRFFELSRTGGWRPRGPECLRPRLPRTCNVSARVSTVPPCSTPAAIAASSTTMSSGLCARSVRTSGRTTSGR